jgi:hypothetical protein
MGEVLRFPLAQRAADMPPPRLLIISDKVVRPETVCDVYWYVTERMEGAPPALLGALRNPKACVCCQHHNVPGAIDALGYLAKSANIRIVAVMCLMQPPPCKEIEELFARSQIFFEDPALLRSMMQHTQASY